MPEFYGELKGLIDELEMHQPSVTNSNSEGVPSGSRSVKVSSGLSPTLRS